MYRLVTARYWGHSDCATRLLKYLAGAYRVDLKLRIFTCGIFQLFALAVFLSETRVVADKACLVDRHIRLHNCAINV